MTTTTNPTRHPTLWTGRPSIMGMSKHPWSKIGDPLSFDGAPEVAMKTCSSCSETHPSVTGFLLRADYVFAIYNASWDGHDSESWVNMTIGSFSEPDYSDQVMFACRIGPIEGHGDSVCSLVTPNWGTGEKPVMGRRLDRDAALEHPWLPDFWETVDWLILNDPFFHQPGVDGAH